MVSRPPAPEFFGSLPVVARRRITPQAQARADRIAAALSGLLEDVPTEPVCVPHCTDDPYRRAPTQPTPQSPTEVVVQLPCPRCGAQLYLHYAKGAEIHRCDRCLGFWLESRQLVEMVEGPTERGSVGIAALQQRMRAMAPREPTIYYRACPHCRGRMNRRNYGDISGVIVDECPEHGLFLDPGEFEAIEVFIKLGGLHAQREHLAERNRVAEQKRANATARAGSATPITARHNGFWDAMFHFLAGAASEGD